MATSLRYALGQALTMGLGLGLLACSGPPPGRLRTALLPVAPAAPHAAFPLPTGTITFRVTWPRRGVEVIPLAADDLELSVEASGSRTPIASTEVQRPSATGSLGPLPAGDYDLDVSAWQSAGKYLNTVPTEVAFGSASVQVLANQSNAANVELADLDPLEIAEFGPTSAFTAQEIAIVGQGFTDYGAGTPSVAIGSATADLLTFDDSHVFASIPAGTTPNGPITVSVDGLSTTSTASFQTIASVSLEPTQLTFTATGTTLVTPPGSTQSLTAVAFDQSGATVSLPDVPWASCCASGTLGQGGVLPPGLVGDQIQPGAMTALFLAGYAGSYSVVVGQGSLTATTAISVQ